MDDTRAKLRSLRDKLAFAAPRAQTRPKTPPELVERLQAALEQVSAAHRLATSPPQASVSPALMEEVIEDAIVEAHVALHDWERLVEREAEAQRARARAGARSERRAHVRQETQVSVRLLRHALSERESGVALSTETAYRPARNVSAGGIFVSVPAGELPHVQVGSVLHVAIDTTLGPQLAFRARAVVARRDGSGLGLRWTPESEHVRQAIESLLAALRRGRLGA